MLRVNESVGWDIRRLFSLDTGWSKAGDQDMLSIASDCITLPIGLLISFDECSFIRHGMAGEKTRGAMGMIGN